MNLITGRADAAHITPRQDAMWHHGLTETESCIFDAYENFAAEIITNNEVRIRSGVGMLQGRFFCIEPNTYDSADIANGNQGEYRKDIIVARITVDASTNTQFASIEVIQGTPAAENPTAPEVTVGDLDAGDLIADYPLIEVLLNGINIESLTPVFDTGWLFNGAGRQKLNFIGINPITSAAEDTVANWLALGAGVAFYNESGQLSGQPNANLIIHNMPSDEGNIHQLAFQQRIGGVWHRGGNLASGWQPWRKVLDETNGIQMKKLWQNASPSSAFGSQNINLDLSSYNFILIGVSWGITEPDKISYFPIQVGKSAFINITYVQSARSRQIDVTTNKVVVGPGYTSSAAQDNKEAIPIEIYGIKGVQ